MKVVAYLMGVVLGFSGGTYLQVFSSQEEPPVVVIQQYQTLPALEARWQEEAP